MSEQQLLVFVSEGGLEGGCTRNPAALAVITHRLKQLLLVSWLAGRRDESCLPAERLQFAYAHACAASKCPASLPQPRVLLQVFGGWPDVAALVAEHPDVLSMSWLGLAGLLTEPQQRQAWHQVAAMAAPAAAAAAEDGAG